MANAQIAAKSCLSSRKKFKLDLSTRQVNQAHLNQKTEDSQEKRVGRKQRNVKEKGIHALPPQAQKRSRPICAHLENKKRGVDQKTSILPLFFLFFPVLFFPILFFNHGFHLFLVSCAASSKRLLLGNIQIRIMYRKNRLENWSFRENK